jgi:hypothetical protein
MDRKLREALPGGDGALLAVVWGAHAADALPGTRRAQPRPFVIDTRVKTTVDLGGHRAASNLDELALNDYPDADAA